MFITSMVMALLAAVIYFVWRYGRGFGIIEALFALYGCACRTRRSYREAGGTDEGLPVLQRCSCCRRNFCMKDNYVSTSL